MPSQRDSYSPFKDSPPEPPASGGSGAAMGVGLAVIAAMLFMVVTLGRGLLASIGEIANPTPPVEEPAPSPPDAREALLTSMRPAGELTEQSEAVETGLFSDTVVCTGRIRNTGAGGKLVVRVRTEYDDPERQPEKGEQVFTIINAGSSEPYRIELSVDNVKRHNPRFIHEVFVP